MRTQLPKILYVDDERQNLKAFKSAFRFDYRIYVADTAQKGLDLLGKHPDIAIVLTDQRMPEMNGVQFLSEVLRRNPDAIRIIVTGYSDLSAVVDSINKGQVFRYITKPWDPRELKMTLDGAYNLYELQKENKQLLKEQEQALMFVAMASHDLRQPVRTIRCYMQLLKKNFSRLLDDDANLYVNFAVDSSKRMHQMITEILSNPVLRTQKLNLKQVNMNEVLDIIRKDLALYISEHNALVQYFDLPTLPADKIAMIQVMQNLISNAIKYSEKTPVINIQAKIDGNDHLFIIKDNGIGMSDTNRIFNMFERLHETEAKYSGKGIGLAVCRQIIKKLGGKIWVESEVGKGSTFYFTLPVSEDAVRQPTVTSKPLFRLSV